MLRVLKQFIFCASIFYLSSRSNAAPHEKVTSALVHISNKTSDSDQSMIKVQDEMILKTNSNASDPETDIQHVNNGEEMILPETQRTPMMHYIQNRVLNVFDEGSKGLQRLTDLIMQGLKVMENKVTRVLFRQKTKTDDEMGASTSTDSGDKMSKNLKNDEKAQMLIHPVFLQDLLNARDELTKLKQELELMKNQEKNTTQLQTELHEMKRQLSKVLEKSQDTNEVESHPENSNQTTPERVISRGRLRPIVAQLIRRLKDKRNPGIIDEIKKILETLLTNKPLREPQIPALSQPILI